MGHKYVKENETFNTSRNGTVPKPTQADVTNNKILQADGTWVDQSGGGGGSSTLAGLSDVVLSSPSDNQILQYDNESSKWVNVDPPASSSSIETLTDVDLDNLSDGQMLQYDNSSSKWVNVDPPAPPVTGVSDVEVNGESVVNEQGNAEIVSYKEVTQAEYNAMPDSKLTDGVLYCIKDAPSGPDGFPPLIYDTVEREVGVWTDGKPLYQKSFYLSSNETTEVTIDVSSLSIDTFLFIPNASYKRATSNGNTVYLGFYVSSEDKYQCFFRRSANQIAIMGTGSSYLGSVVVTIRYTKTTDTAGSGTWTKQGTLAHHYSTSEQIVGTWIDGKPLYEKTVIVPVSSCTITNKVMTIPFTSANEKLLRIVDAFTSDSTYSRIEYGGETHASNSTDANYIRFGWYYGSFCLYTANTSYWTNLGDITIIYQYTKTTD